MIINMCITPNSVSDTKRPREAMTAQGKDATHTEGRTIGNSPKVRMLYDNMCFLLDQRKIYLDKDISLVRRSFPPSAASLRAVLSTMPLCGLNT